MAVFIDAMLRKNALGKINAYHDNTHDLPFLLV